jgi:hypothetical protein
MNALKGICKRSSLFSLNVPVMSPNIIRLMLRAAKVGFTSCLMEKNFLLAAAHLSIPVRSR